MDGPAYRSLARSGELGARARRARQLLQDCVLCARRCHVDRTVSLAGAACRTGERAVVATAHPHPGEEAVISGSRGSGAIFFSWCNLRCSYCQNAEVSQRGSGREVSATELAGLMLNLQERGCHNINLVSPSHVVAQILEAVEIAAGRGLTLPLVYNTGGYDSMEALRLLSGVVDIYMPDMKYADDQVAETYSKVADYVVVNRAAVREMHRQVGPLQLDAGGLARRGLLVRHLVLPGGLSGTREVLAFIARELSPDTWVSLMDQYHPAYRAGEYPPLLFPLSPREYHTALGHARELGLTRLDPPTVGGAPQGYLRKIHA